METETPLLHCTSTNCDWALTGENFPVCINGGGSCQNAKLLVAEVSDFHDQALAEVTQQINALLQAIPPDPAGRKLSFMHSPLGTLLGWVQHDGAGLTVEAAESAVRATSDEAALVQSLRLLV